MHQLRIQTLLAPRALRLLLAALPTIILLVPLLPLLLAAASNAAAEVAVAVGSAAATRDCMLYSVLHAETLLEAAALSLCQHESPG